MSNERESVKIENDEDIARLFQRNSPSLNPVNDISMLEHDILEQAMKVGISNKSVGTFFMVDRDVILKTVNKYYEGKVEIMTTRQALENGYEEYYWKALPKEKADFYTKYGEENLDDGYFILIHENVSVDIPVQSCLFIRTDRYNQNVHNIIIARKGSQAHLLTGCTLSPKVKSAMHIGISEFYVEENATLSFTMVHNWNENSIVHPRTGVVVKDGGKFISNYVLTTPVFNLKAAPLIRSGKNSRIRSTMLIFLERGKVDIGTNVHLDSYSRAEIISRVVAKDGIVISRGYIQGNDNTRGHIECKGMLTSDGKGSISSIPEIEAKHSTAMLTHEAAIGTLNPEQITYLMARGLDEEKAISLLTRGFLDAKILELPPQIEQRVKKYMDMTLQAKM